MKKFIGWVIFDDYNDFRIGWIILTAFAAVITFLIILGVPLAWGINSLESKSCHQSLSRLHLEGDYGFWTGCVVEVDGTSIPLDNYFVNEQK